MPTPVAPLAGAFRVGAAGAVLGAGGTKPGDPGRAVGGGPADAAGDRVADDRAGAFVHAPAGDQASAGGEFGVARGRDLAGCADDVPDARLVDDAGEEAGRRSCTGQAGAERGVLGAGRLGLEGAREDEGLVQDAVKVEVPCARGGAVTDRRVVPHVAGDDGVAGHRMVRAGGLLEVGHELARCGVDAQEVVRVDLVGRLALRRGLGDERDRRR